MGYMKFPPLKGPLENLSEGGGTGEVHKKYCNKLITNDETRGDNNNRRATT